MLIQKAPLRGRFFLLQMSYLTLGGFFFLGSWLAPNHYPPWTSFHNEAMMFAAVIIFSLHAVNEAKSMKAPWLLYGLTGALIVLICYSLRRG